MDRPRELPFITLKNQNKMQILDICLSDLPSAKMTEYNGKKYIRIIVDKLREPTDKHDLSVYVSQTKEEREAKAKRTYVGRGKNYDNQSKQQQQQHYKQAPVNTSTDLPF